MKIRTLVYIAFFCLAPISCTKDAADGAANYKILHKVINPATDRPFES